MFLQNLNQINTVSKEQRKFKIEYLINDDNSNNDIKIASEYGSDIIRGLNHKSKFIPMHYRYDELGSQLFEKICEVPEYYLTRTETSILHSSASEIARITGLCEIVELGSGNSIKTRILLDAYNKLGSPLCYLPIDISTEILETSALDLLNDYPSLQVHAFAGTFESAIDKLPSSRLPSRMISFIGSTIGGLSYAESDTLLKQIATALDTGEYFLLGIDLHKSTQQLETAYNDALGVNAEFNFNILKHLNYKFSGNFKPKNFEHVVIYNENSRQVEIYLKSRKQQNIQLKTLGLNIVIEDEELILTAVARKFELNSVEEKLKTFGLQKVQNWTDSKQWYTLLLCQKHA